jgi:hypothetical protein
MAYCLAFWRFDWHFLAFWRFGVRFEKRPVMILRGGISDLVYDDKEYKIHILTYVDVDVATGHHRNRDGDVAMLKVCWPNSCPTLSTGFPF